MKKVTRFLGLLIVILFLGGIVLVLLGGTMTDWPDMRFVGDKIFFGDGISIDRDVFTKVETALEKNAIFHIGDNDMFADDEKVWQGDVPKTKVASDSVKNWNLELGGCNFVEKFSEDDAYYVEYKGKGKSQAYVKGDELFVKVLNSSNISIDEENCFTLYIPAEVELDKAEIELGAGKAMVGGFIAKEMKSSIGAGELFLTATKLGKVEVEVGAGKCTIWSEITDELKAECAMGSLELKLKGKEEDFDYKIEAVSGSVSLGGQQYSGLAKEKEIDNDADKKMELECAMGSIQVNFE
ncbi:MAG: DUF4097 family beta strand repeat protein [Lachnospiraceae bacterium]|nr:DUF4097 family beta strand repeat protein [Lachnospiraceae bacterium]